MTKRLTWTLAFLTALAWSTPSIASSQNASADEARVDSESIGWFSPPEADGPIRIDVGVWVLDVDAIDSAKQNFQANFYLSLRWKDPRLAHGADGSVPRSPNEVWTPRPLVANEAGGVRATLPEVIEVQSDGSATYRQRFIGSFSQPLDLARFPFDQHTFELHIVLPGLTSAEVELVPDERLVERGLVGAIGIAEKISLPDWELLDIQAVPKPYVLLQGVDAAGYAFQFRAARDTMYWIWKVILPLALIVAMSWAVFWIDPENSGTQIGVATTVMLTLIAYRFAIETRVPPVSYMTRLDWFISCLTVLVFLTLLETLLTSKLVRSKRQALALRVDVVSRVAFPAAFAAVAVLSFAT